MLKLLVILLLITGCASHRNNEECVVGVQSNNCSHMVWPESGTAGRD